MPLTQVDLAALQGMMATQLNGLQSLLESVGAQFQTMNQQLATSTSEQERLAREKINRRIREERVGLSVPHGVGNQTRGPLREIEGCGVFFRGRLMWSFLSCWSCLGYFESSSRVARCTLNPKVGCRSSMKQLRPIQQSSAVSN